MRYLNPTIILILLLLTACGTQPRISEDAVYIENGTLRYVLIGDSARDTVEIEITDREVEAGPSGKLDRSYSKSGPHFHAFIDSGTIDGQFRQAFVFAIDLPGEIDGGSIDNYEYIKNMFSDMLSVNFAIFGTQLTKGSYVPDKWTDSVVRICHKNTPKTLEYIIEGVNSYTLSRDISEIKVEVLNMDLKNPRKPLTEGLVEYTLSAPLSRSELDSELDGDPKHDSIHVYVHYHRTLKTTD